MCFFLRITHITELKSEKHHRNNIRRRVSYVLTKTKTSFMTKIWCFSSIRERLKEVLRQYELRERHFECIIRSKELEVLLSRARAAEQKQLAEGEKNRANKLDDEVCIHLPGHA